MAHRTSSIWKRLAIWGLICIATVVVILLLMAFVPFDSFRYQTSTALTYDEAMRTIREKIASEPASILPEGHPVVLTHDAPTERVFVLLHGLSNCPAQFLKFGESLFAKGHNVLIPRMPYHGESDRMNTEWGQLTAQMMLDEANEAVDLAKALGQRVTVVGLSVNGTTVAWMAQNRSDIDQAVLLAPFLAPKGIPLWAMKPLASLMVRLPNRFIWWNATLKENIPGPVYSYPRFPTRVIGQVMRLGEEVLAQSRQEAPLSNDILVITSGSDQAISRAALDQLLQQWKAFKPDAVHTYMFPTEQKVAHDFIDPNQPDERVDLVYPKLMELLLGGATKS